MNKLDGLKETALGIYLSLLQVATNKYFLSISLAFTSLFGAYLKTYNSFIYVLVICIVADSTFGVWLAIKEGRFKWKKAVAIVEKTVVYFFYLLITHSISKVEFLIDFDQIKYVHIFCYTVMIINEAKSAFVLGNSVYPNPIMRPIVSLLEKIDDQTITKKEDHV